MGFDHYDLTYTDPWDADKHVGCICDLGYRGPDCSLQECPTGPDVMLGDGNSKGRDFPDVVSVTTPRVSASASRVTSARAARARPFSVKCPGNTLPRLMVCLALPLVISDTSNQRSHYVIG